jgi:hypothetical protein
VNLHEHEIGIALNQIVIICLDEIRLDRAKLEVEEKGREVAAAQGRIAGYKELLKVIQESFELPDIFFEDTFDRPMNIPDLADEIFFLLQDDIARLTELECWKIVLKKIAEEIEGLKTYLLFDAENTRALDICQGKRKGMMAYERLFNATKSDAERRERKAKEEKESPEFAFNDTPGAGEREDGEDSVDDSEEDGGEEEDAEGEESRTEETAEATT